MSSMKGLEPDWIYMTGYTQDLILGRKQMEDMGISAPIITMVTGPAYKEFTEGLGDLADNVLSISPAAYDQAPDYTERFREKFGYFMVHEAQEHAACMGCLHSALEAAGSADHAAIREQLQNSVFDQGWATVMSGGKVEFDEMGRNIHASPLMVQWRGGELVTVYPKEYATGEVVWNS